MIQGIIFDLFGTIIYENREPPRLQEFAKLIGRNLDDHEFLKLIETHFMTSLYGDYREPVAGFLQKLGIPADEQKLNTLLSVLKDFAQDSFVMYEDAKAALRTLKGKYKLGLFTNTTAPVFQTVRERFRLYDIFEGITTSFEQGHIKPEKAMFLAALHSLGLNRDQVLFVGSSFKEDLRAAENIGLNALLIDRMNKHMQCDRRIERMQEIVKFLK